jgi:hypothetical protein
MCQRSGGPLERWVGWDTSPLDVSPSSSVSGLLNGTGAMRHLEIITLPVDGYKALNF